MTYLTFQGLKDETWEGNGVITEATETCAMARDKDCCSLERTYLSAQKLTCLCAYPFVYLPVCLPTRRSSLRYLYVCLSDLLLAVTDLLVCLGLTCSSICCGAW